MSKKTKILVASIFAAIVLIAGAVAVFLNIKETSAGNKSFTFTVVSDRDSYNETLNCESDLEYFGQYLRTLPECEYQESEYGIYITGYNGMAEDIDNQYWWCVCVNGESATTGADEIPLADGTEYSLVLMQGW